MFVRTKMWVFCQATATQLTAMRCLLFVMIEAQLSLIGIFTPIGDARDHVDLSGSLSGTPVRHKNPAKPGEGTTERAH